MKIKYLASFAAIALLSTGVFIACATPEASKDNAASTTTTTATKPDPCAAKSADPCAAKKADPCAAKSADPCAAKKADPCAAKSADPCAAKKADPCAAKSASAASIGGPLAQKLQGKPVVVDVYASWCSACKNIAPTVSDLKKEYEGKVEFVVLDVSDKSTTAAAEATAQELGLSKFLAENKTQTGSLTIVDPATGKILAQHRNNADKMAYTKVLDAALTK
ncbi:MULTISPECIES: thioredoxin domain-containing protein [Pseudanabaena]|uniref:thioredoxin domain-containing protein n=1 Tax=Pseudanabaena TaxID=1152 RepID=UPI002478A6BF|nr:MULTISPECIES: thioredoxin domain-containing protein [Pseudanabaena]MEA5490318.1 thioredoxin domain-containing protein [Pseudanabaena sp. CCNP1317]WGS74893.1 thioredoxin domain-containing protein [Pseudanabaena galeata CCNP1313]